MSVERQSREGRQLDRVGPRWAFLSSVFKQLIGGAHGRKFLTEHNGAELIPAKSRQGRGADLPPIVVLHSAWSSPFKVTPRPESWARR
jgi:hypothetical protein